MYSACAGVLAFAPCANARGYPLLAAHRLAGDLVAAFDALACPERGGGGCLPAEVIAVRRSRKGQLRCRLAVALHTGLKQYPCPNDTYLMTTYCTQCNKTPLQAPWYLCGPKFQ